MQKFYTHKIIINKEQNLKRLDQALAKLLDNVTRSQIKILLQNHNVKKNNNIITEAALKVKEGEEYFIAIPNVQQTSYKPENIPLKLRISLRRSLYHEQLIRLLIGGCGLNVEHDIDDNNSSIELLITGDVLAEDLRSISGRLVTQSEELMDIDPVWKDGMIGVMQLVVMAQAAQILRERAP